MTPQLLPPVQYTCRQLASGTVGLTAANQDALVEVAFRAWQASAAAAELRQVGETVGGAGDGEDELHVRVESNSGDSETVLLLGLDAVAHKPVADPTELVGIITMNESGEYTNDTPIWLSVSVDVVDPLCSAKVDDRTRD